MASIDFDKHIWEGWTVGAFIEELETPLSWIMDGESWQRPFTTKAELKKWCTEFPRNDEFIQLTRMETDEYDCYLPMEHEILHVGSLWMRDINLKIERGCSLTLMEKKMMNWYNQNVTK